MEKVLYGLAPFHNGIFGEKFKGSLSRALEKKYSGHYAEYGQYATNADKEHVFDDVFAFTKLRKAKADEHNTKTQECAF